MLHLKNTLDGYLKNVEVIGNTIQDINNLADIRSVGDKVEGQELYKIDIVSCGKNLFDGVYKDNSFLQVTGGGIGDLGSASGHKATPNYVKLKPNSTYRFSTSNSQGVGIILFFYDKNKKYIRYVDTHIMTYTKLTTNENEHYIRWYGTDANISAFTNAQLEEGTQATPYEPFKEDKLEILSPVQLEKVGDVADRIICKDGVWGVDKNIVTEMLDGTENWHMQTGTYVPTDGNFAIFYLNNPQVQLNRKIMCDKIPSVETVTGSTNKFAIGGHSSVNGIRICIEKSKLSTVDVNGFKSWLQNAPITVKFISVQSQFIPLPHDQQVKLRTFAGQTNIAFLTEIAGQIKAQVPKSLGAVVNTHTEQIEMLHNALKSVLAGDMYSLATILYPEDFTQDNSEQDIMVIPE